MRRAQPPQLAASRQPRLGRVGFADRVHFMAKGNFGERLKRERELREVSPNEVVVATRISLRFLEALENEDWDKLPGGVFNRGFVRAIARYLGLDEENLLAEYDLARGDQAPEFVSKPGNRIPQPSRWFAVGLALGALVIIAALVAAGVYGWRRYSTYRRGKPSSALTQSAAGDPPSANSAALDLSVSTSAPTRVRILSDGKLAFDSEIPPGQKLHFPAETAFEITASDSATVLLELNGQAMPPIGSPGASGTIVLSQKDLRPASGGNSQP
jgi:cytoskeleton protein RodZ